MPSDLLFAQSEKIAGRLPELFSTMDTIVNRFNRKATTEMISERDIRVPLLTTEGGRPGTFNPNFGAFVMKSPAGPWALGLTSSLVERSCQAT